MLAMFSLQIFVILLASLLMGQATPVATPTELRRLALRKLPIIRSGEHPYLAFQRHQNSAIKRLHRFRGLEVPSNHMLVERILQRKREIGEVTTDERLWYSPITGEKNENERRLWFPPAVDATSEEDLLENASNQTITESLPKAAAATDVAEAQRVAPGANEATTTISADGSNADGFSKAAFEALEDDSVLPSDSSLVPGGLNYEIEANDVGYLATIQLGTPPADFLMLMDSGSGDTWVPSSDCGLAQCGPHQALGADVSSTFKATQTPFSVTYGSGSVTGALCSDTMSIAGMTLPNHVFGVTTEESQQFAAAQVPFDGLMGLSFSSLSQQNTSTPIESLAAAGLVIQAVMGFALGRVADGENDGEIIFGQPDTSKFDPAMTQVLPVSSESGFWQVAMADVTVNGQSTAQTRQAILDTGTSLMIAPSADAIAFHAQIQGAQASANGMFTIPCTSEAAITMTFGDTAFQIDARDLIFQPVSNDLQGDCISSLSSGTVVDDVTWLLGDTFLKNVYFTTNVEQRTVELSARTDVPGSSGNSTAVRANVEMSDANKARNSMYYVASALASLFLVWH